MSEVLKVQRPGVNLDDFERRLYASSNADRVNDDPLAELSRIVGKADPFKGLFANTPASKALQRREPSADIFSLPPRNEQAPRPAPAINFSAPQNPASQPAAPKVTLPQYSPPQYSAPPISSAQKFSAGEDFRAGGDKSLAPHFFDEMPQDASIEQDAADFFSHLAPNAQDEAPFAPDEFPAAEEPRQGRSSRGLALLMGVLLIAAIGGGAAIGLRGQANRAADGSLPLIKASSTPVRVEPAATDAEKTKQEADAAAAASDSAAKVTTKEEQPVEVIQPAGSPPIKIARIIPLSGEQAHPTTDAAGATQPAASATPGTPSPANGFPEPKPVKTVSVRPDGSIIGTEQSVSPPATQVMASAAISDETAGQSAGVPVPATRPNLPIMAVSGAPSSATPEALVGASKPVKASTPKVAARALSTTKPTVAANGVVPLQLTPAGTKPAKASKAAPVLQADATAAAAVPAATASGVFSVQLGAPASEAEAKAFATKIQTQYATELSGYKASIHKADLGGGRTVYRVRVANLSRDEAVALCEKLHAGGGQCFIAH